MWTYLLILFSIVVFVAVFVRRWILLSRAPSKDALDEILPEESLCEKVRLSKKDKDVVSSLYRRGDALIAAGKDEEAIKCFVQALSLNPSHQETLHRLGVLYLQKQMFGAAVALFQQLAEISPDPLHFSHLGLALFNQSDFESSKVAYQKALELDSSRAQRFVSLSQVYRAMDMPLHAIVALNKAIEIEDKNIEALFLLADAKLEIKKLECAKTILQNVLELDPENKDAKVLLAEIDSLEKEISG
jgi:tetratricopeptide (TPR) repeat protein